MRKDIRFRLDTPAIFSWEGACRRILQGEGITRDISVQGAFILTAICPSVECTIQVDLILPPLAGMKTMVRITGKARVLRVDHASRDSGANGFAVVTDDLRQWGLITIPLASERELAEGAGAALKVNAN